MILINGLSPSGIFFSTGLFYILSGLYFGVTTPVQPMKVTSRALCIRMALANMPAFVFGGMPLCHGAGGLAAHYRFEARTAGSNVMIGLLMVASTVFVGDQLPAFFHRIPMAVLGVLLFFAGGHLVLTIVDIQNRAQLFVAVTMLGVTLATNLAVGFGSGWLLALVMRCKRLKP